MSGTCCLSLFWLTYIYRLIEYLCCVDQSASELPGMKLVWKMEGAGSYWRSQNIKQNMLIKSAVPTGVQPCIALEKQF